MKEIWMKNDEQRIMNDEWRMNEGWWKMNDEWRMMMISSCWGVLQTDERTNGWTDIGDCRVAFATENQPYGETLASIGPLGP